MGLALAEAGNVDETARVGGMPRRPPAVEILRLQNAFDIIQRFEAVDGEVGAHDEHAPAADVRPPGERVGRARSEPVAILVEPALVGDGPSIACETELLGDAQARCPGLQLVAISRLDVGQGNRMVGEQQAVVALGIETRVADRSGDRAQVRRIGMVVLDELD